MRPPVLPALVLACAYAASPAFADTVRAVKAGETVAGLVEEGILEAVPFDGAEGALLDVTLRMAPGAGPAVAVLQPDRTPLADLALHAKVDARGAVLTAADLIKNFVFQRLLEQDADVDEAYSKYWEQFETAFWEEEVSVGRVRLPRSSVFLNHWLIARTGEEVVARVDLHYTTSVVYGVLIVERVLDLEELAQLRTEIDDELVQTADVPRDDFLLAVYRGEPLRQEPFSDEDDLTDDPDDPR